VRDIIESTVVESLQFRIYYRIMPNNFKITIVQTSEDLGVAARNGRTRIGVSLRKSAKDNPYGVRFLSEFERGKTTVELGKVIKALHAAGLDLAVVPRKVAIAHQKINNTKRLSERLNFEFPYDWSNPNISESVFIYRVLEKTRFNDILTVVYCFGFEKIEQQTENFADLAQYEIINKYLKRIKKGYELAGNINDHH